ncbi:hypothetical protein C8P63_11094 [Melghirimyces profundicolus]|uniref:Uncharacterized protein n=1 Tax=Melghirimyces profundicolus TaxID=1242148 RepID=A0A2T6BV52_9BACL|nr:hypothetical protein [Melghirimyces profundicolus]PTX59949.1 hypothetical protein C8P63_11094 [Melghirimyces profundicolus]
MNIRWRIAVLTLFVSLFALFGGFYGYQWYNVEKPIRETVEHTPHVHLKTLSVQPDRITLRFKPDPEFSLVSDYLPLREKVKAHAGDRKLDIHFADRPDSSLRDAWNRMSFGVKEGIAHRRYTAIPETVEKVAKKEGIRYRLSMDAGYVYVELHKGDRFLYQVLPLNKAEGEVNNNG